MAFRPKADSGEWLAFLLPLALSASLLQQQGQVNEASIVTFVLSYLMAFHCMQAASKVLYVQAKKSSKKNLWHNLDSFWKNCTRGLLSGKEKKQQVTKWGPKTQQQSISYTDGIIMLLMATLLWLLQTSLVSIILATLAQLLFVLYLPQLFSNFELSFTFGEGCLALQASILYGTHSLISLINDLDNPANVEGTFAIVSKVGLLSLYLLCLAPSVPGLSFVRSSTWFYVSGMSILGTISLPFLWWKLRRNPLLWLSQHILGSPHILLLVCFWTMCLLCSFYIVIQQDSQATTTTRKYFHGLIVLVYTSGLLVDKSFLFFSSILVLCLMLLFEYVRVFSIQPFGYYLNESFKIFRDEKDVGQLILTHMYLLAGVSLPLWLCSDLHDNANMISLLSGVLSIGIGDSAASIFGSHYGKIKFPSSTKTVEGTVASVVAQVLFLYTLHWFNVINSSCVLSAIIPITIVSVIEALTTQVDNIVLPLLLYTLSTIL